MTSSSGKRVLLGITGGVAAYKAAALVRLLVRADWLHIAQGLIRGREADAEAPRLRLVRTE